MQKGGMLDERTDIAALARKAFIRLDGVSDKWLDSVAVEKVPGGDVPPGQDLRQLAAMLQLNPVASCCRRPQ
jgi:hypothetical protein